MEALLQTNLPSSGPTAEIDSSLDPSDLSDPSGPSALAKSAASQMPTPISQRKSWSAVEWLPMQLSVALPIPRFCVRDLLALDPGQNIVTEWPNGDDLPLSIEDVQLAWIEMEAVDHDMAVRITRLL